MQTTNRVFGRFIIFKQLPSSFMKSELQPQQEQLSSGAAPELTALDLVSTEVLFLPLTL